MCANKMPNLVIPYSVVTAEELTIIQPLLDHIKDCLCAGVEEDFAHFTQWLGHLAQKPDRIARSVAANNLPSCSAQREESCKDALARQPILCR